MTKMTKTWMLIETRRTITNQFWFWFDTVYRPICSFVLPPPAWCVCGAELTDVHNWVQRRPLNNDRTAVRIKRRQTALNWPPNWRPIGNRCMTAMMVFSWLTSNQTCRLQTFINRSTTNQWIVAICDHSWTFASRRHRRRRIIRSAAEAQSLDPPIHSQST